MVRCTSPIGFVIPILYKVIKEDTLFGFFIAGIGIAIPLLFLIMLFDSFNYQQMTFVPFRFIQKNLIENISSNYGVSSPFEYILYSLPLAFNGFSILLIFAIKRHITECRKKELFPYFLVMAISYIYIFSLIPHKEDRFILPIVPFLFLIIG